MVTRPLIPVAVLAVQPPATTRRQPTIPPLPTPATPPTPHHNRRRIRQTRQQTLGIVNVFVGMVSKKDGAKLPIAIAFMELAGFHSPM